MFARLRPLKPYVGLVARHPLHLIAAYAAAVIAEVLLTIQPLFLRGFIDGAQSGLSHRELWQFPAFMVAAAGLTYAFDFISVAIRFLLQRRIERGLKEVSFGISAESAARTTSITRCTPGSASWRSSPFRWASISCSCCRGSR